MPNRKLNVFLCHAKEDKPTVRELYRKLSTEGWMDIWLDEENLFPGQEWDMEIEKAVEQADVVLVCLSKHSVDKEGYVQKELRFVLNIAEEKPEGTIFVIPLRLDDCIVPRRLRNWQYADYFPIEERGRAYERLLVSLRMRAKRLDIPTANLAEEQARKSVEEKTHKENQAHEQKEAEERVRLLAEQNARKGREPREKKEASVKTGKEKQDRERIASKPRGKNETEKHQSDKVIEKPFETKQSSAAIADIPVVSLSSTERPAPPKSHLPAYGIGAIVILIFIFLGFGGNYIFQKFTQQIYPTNLPDTNPSQVVVTNKPPTAILLSTNRPPSSPTIGSTWLQTKDGMTMLFIPESAFTMGSYYGESDQKPIHTVYLDSYWIDQTEVTNTMFATFLNSEGNQIDGEVSWLDSEDSDVRIHLVGNVWQADVGYENYPVIEVSWFGAQAYCAWADRRLPSEAEWDKAASWDDKTKTKYDYPWGNEQPNSSDTDLLNYSKRVGGPTEVGKYPKGASFYGVLDMAGNVWEWVADWYSETYYSNSSASNPLGPSSGTSRVLRGGSWYDGDLEVTSANRYLLSPDFNGLNIGFRCARSE